MRDSCGNRKEGGARGKTWRGQRQGLDTPGVSRGMGRGVLLRGGQVQHTHPQVEEGQAQNPIPTSGGASVTCPSCL